MPLMENDVDPAILDAWRGLLFSHAKVIRVLEREMSAQHDIPLTWFDILSRLTDTPDHRMRMTELEEASLFTRSGITAIADRLETAGFVERQRSSEDRRGVYLAITQAGLDKFAEVWVDHQRSIQEHFGRHIDAEDAEAITRATKKVRFPDGE